MQQSLHPWSAASWLTGLQHSCSTRQYLTLQQPLVPGARGVQQQGWLPGLTNCPAHLPMPPKSRIVSSLNVSAMRGLRGVPCCQSTATRLECYWVAGWPACECTASSRLTCAPVGNGSAQQVNRNDMWLQVDPVRVHRLQQAEAAAMRQGQHNNTFPCHYWTQPWLACWSVELVPRLCSLHAVGHFGWQEPQMSISQPHDMSCCHCIFQCPEALWLSTCCFFTLLHRECHGAACRVWCVGLAFPNSCSWQCLSAGIILLSCIMHLLPSQSSLLPAGLGLWARPSWIGLMAQRLRRTAQQATRRA